MFFMSNAYDTPNETCPYCQSNMHADWVDVGVGMVQCGPYSCMDCGASEIGPEFSDWVYKDRNDNPIHLIGKRYYNKHFQTKMRMFGEVILKPGHPFNPEELRTGYYQGAVSPYANTVNGELVDHKTAKSAYNIGLLDEKSV